MKCYNFDFDTVPNEMYLSHVNCWAQFFKFKKKKICNSTIVWKDLYTPAAREIVEEVNDGDISDPYIVKPMCDVHNK